MNKKIFIALMLLSSLVEGQIMLTNVSKPDRITDITNPQSISVLNGTTFASVPFPTTVRAKRNGFWNDFAVTFLQGSYDHTTNGSYTLSGRLTDFATPVSITVWVIPAPTQWFDGIDNTLYGHTIDNVSRMITSGSGKVGATITEGVAADVLYNPSWNGDGINFNTQTALTWGSASTHNTFHQDTPWSIYVVWYQKSVGNTHLGPIYISNAGASGSTGIALFVDNRIASSNTYAITYLVTKGVGGSVPINLTTADNVVDPNAWNWAKIKFDGTNFTLYVNGSLEASSTPSISFATGNASNALRIGNLNSIGVGTGASMFLKHVYMEDSFVSGATETLLDSWAVAMSSEGVPLEDVNVYLMCGQSNMAGRGVSSGIAADLTGAIDAFIYVPKPTPPTQTNGSGALSSASYWEELELGRNQTFENVATQHGMEMRFGRDMSTYIKNCFLIKMGIGGTPIFSTATYNDWNAGHNELYELYRILAINGLQEIESVFRKNPVIRGFIWMQGETDAIISTAGAAYKTNFYTFINNMIDAIEVAYPINKMRIYIFRITNSGAPGYDMTEFNAIYAAQEDIGDDYLTDNAGHSDDVLGSTWRTTDDLSLLDAQHYSGASLDIMGKALFAYFKQYVDE